MNLLAHIRGDGDLLAAWFEHYRHLGVTAFHIIVHGPREENAELHRLATRYRVQIRDEYNTAFLSEEKARRMNSVLATLPSAWMLVVDSDEFLEIPYATLEGTIRVLDRLDSSALYAPFLQRLTHQGSLDTPDVIGDPFHAMPLCSVGLYPAMGVHAAEAKYPLFRKSRDTQLEAGNHLPPNGSATRLTGVRGVTHHFKWRRPVLNRLAIRANSTHTWRHESAGFLAHLGEHGHRLPIAGSFVYSRHELFRRGLLRRAAAADYARTALAGVYPLLPAPAQSALRRLARLAVRSGLRSRPDD